MVQRDTHVHPERSSLSQSTRAANLALLSASVSSADSNVSLSSLARAITASGLTSSHCHRQRVSRLFRFLFNDLFDPLDAQTTMIPHIAEAAHARWVVWVFCWGWSTTCRRPPRPLDASDCPNLEVGTRERSLGVDTDAAKPYTLRGQSAMLPRDAFEVPDICPPLGF